MLIITTERKVPLYSSTADQIIETFDARKLNRGNVADYD